jgi:hypothetical protein
MLSTEKYQGEQFMLFEKIDNMSKLAFARTKWLLTALSGALTAGLIVVLES